MGLDLLNLGTQGVLTAQRQLNTTSHNINNVNTEGFSRQSVVQDTNMPHWVSGANLGAGVHVAAVRRSFDQFATNELNLSTTNLNYSMDTEANLDVLTNMMSSIGAKRIPENINDWFDAVKTLADSPNEIGARKVVLEKSRLVSQSLNDFYENVRQQNADVNKKMDLTVERMNAIALELKDINKMMVKTPGPHNDLMDRHEKLIKELSQYTKVTITKRDNENSFNVLIGGGHMLVSGTNASELKMIAGTPDPLQRRLAMVEGKGMKAIQHDSIGGKLSALFELRDSTIPTIMDELGRVAVGFSSEVNRLQSQAIDLRGQIGANIFSDVNSEQAARSRAIVQGGSSAEVGVFIDDISLLKAGDYALKYDGSQYTVTRPTGEVQRLDPTGNPSTFFLDGMRVEIREPLSAGERVLLRPTRIAAGEIKLEMNEAEKIAAQSYASSATFATGNAKFKVLQSGALKEFQVVISPAANQFAVLDMKGKMLLEPQTYPPKGPVTVGGTTFELTGGAAANDKFAANLVPSEGDNGNLLLMQGLQTRKVMDEGRSTVIDLYENVNTEIGLKKATASRLSEVSRVENEAAQSRVASVSGVNLDEEAANMMKFQQAYMASSRIMKAADETFNSILQLS
ncbi:flagellar hook-associated protein FlgK [Aliivibrio fischeri]|uniref:Flagellar hook-associated protein 1 n=1 Tax=Aliivibrio fischeri TaxID=668 RepID=A0A510UHS5_ALIFS|nr:flagellar hook-associated protein FlgK [Aliivibrio fischeri]MUI53889.1 flagellar hook-associated protein FlgK [Aliivibrio fischeri]MUJ38584.1 flagellar hook-associated protein FlgK [Aliivibrio fischeri]MUK48444.1 flagellar hook-associated protein FlgK [Aliivibrio fischeri]GEK12881.1 flagellar hook protein FlgK [Aliivibrio fischeri]